MDGMRNRRNVSIRVPPATIRRCAAVAPKAEADAGRVLEVLRAAGIDHKVLLRVRADGAPPARGTAAAPSNASALREWCCGRSAGGDGSDGLRAVRVAPTSSAHPSSSEANNTRRRGATARGGAAHATTGRGGGLVAARQR